MTWTLARGSASEVSRFRSLREEKSVEFIKSLQRLFALMLHGNRSFVDPTEVLELVYDETSKKVLIGDQRDIIEYLMIFLEHAEIGLALCDPTQNNTLQISTNLKLRTMDVFRGKLAAEIVNSITGLVEEDFGPILVDVRYRELVESLRQKFNYSIRLNGAEV